MITKHGIKYFIRSKSLRLTRDRLPSSRTKGLAEYRWQGRKIYYRPGTSDTEVIYNILLRPQKKSEYWVPQKIDPKVILDIGGNIGIASVYFCQRFPQAKIHTFEPMQDNLFVLGKNIEHCQNVTAYPVALGGEDGSQEILLSDTAGNYGGFSFYEKGCGGGRATVQVRNVAALLQEESISQVDLIKIDTEGSEYNIITAMDPAMLKSVRWVMGELHGERDFEVLAYLSQWFDIAVRKKLRSRLFMFSACNKEFPGL